MFDAAEPKEVSRAELVGFVSRALEDGEVSWVTTDSRSFGWEDVNMNRKAFLRSLKHLHFGMVFIGVFYPGEKRTEYSSFKVVGATSAAGRRNQGP